MESAVFSLIHYQFSKVLIDFTIKSDSKNWNINLIPKGVYDGGLGIFYLSFAFEGVLQEGESPKIQVVCDAEFQFKQMVEQNAIPEYFYRNSIAILFPYIRAFISTVTLQANILPPVILPTYNLSSLGSELFKNTIFK